MNTPHEIICIACPKGCITRVIELDGEAKVLGRICKQGRIYVQEEFKDPRRILTSTVSVAGDSSRRLAVRTARSIPKKNLMAAMAALSGICAVRPLNMGDVVYKNICDGIDLIASEDLR